MKCSAALVDGQWRDVYKDPATDPGKTSLKGRLTLLRDGNTFHTVQVGARAWTDGEVDALRLVYEDGRLLVDDAFADVRLRAAAWL